jgi:hypothetical protein
MRVGLAWTVRLVVGLPLVLVLTPPARGDDGVVVTSTGHGVTATTPTYRAIVQSDGCLHSVRVGDTELLADDVGFSRGSYFYPGEGPPAELRDVVTAGAQVTTRNASLRSTFTFERGSIRMELENGSEAGMSFYILLSDALQTVTGSNTPVLAAVASGDESEQLALGFSDGTRLTVVSPLRYWGPWGDKGGRQVLEIHLPARSTRTVSLHVEPGGAEPSAAPAPPAGHPSAQPATTGPGGDDPFSAAGDARDLPPGDPSETPTAPGAPGATAPEPPASEPPATEPGSQPSSADPAVTATSSSAPPAESPSCGRCGASAAGLSASATFPPAALVLLGLLLGVRHLRRRTSERAAG